MEQEIKDKLFDSVDKALKEIKAEKLEIKENYILEFIGKSINPNKKITNLIGITKTEKKLVLNDEQKLRLSEKAIEEMKMIYGIKDGENEIVDLFKLQINNDNYKKYDNYRRVFVSITSYVDTQQDAKHYYLKFYYYNLSESGNLFQEEIHVKTPITEEVMNDLNGKYKLGEYTERIPSLKDAVVIISDFINDKVDDDKMAIEILDATETVFPIAVARSIASTISNKIPIFYRGFIFNDILEGKK